MRSPITWFGGKGKLAPKLLPLFPEHTRYVELFGGGASMLFAKPPVSVEVYNDVDGGLVNLFQVLRDPELFLELQRRLVFTPYARQEYNDSRAWWKEHGDEDGDPVTRAWHFFVVARMSFSGRFGASWGSVVDSSKRGMVETASKWLTTIDDLPAVHRRLMRVQIECYDWRVILDRYSGLGWLVYADPTYVQETRKSGGYEHELADGDHEDLIDRLLAYDGSVVLSGYNCDAYRRLDGVGNWSRVDIETVCHAAGKTRASGLQGKGSATKNQSRVESVWVKDMSGVRCGDREKTMIGFGWLKRWWDRDRSAWERRLLKMGGENPPAPKGSRPAPPPPPPPPWGRGYQPRTEAGQEVSAESLTPPKEGMAIEPPRLAAYGCILTDAEIRRYCKMEKEGILTLQDLRRLFAPALPPMPTYTYAQGAPCPRCNSRIGKDHYCRDCGCGHNDGSADGEVTPPPPPRADEFQVVEIKDVIGLDGGLLRYVKIKFKEGGHFEWRRRPWPGPPPGNQRNR